MKIITLKENLNKGLSIVSRLTGRNLALPILNNVLISSEKNFLNLSTTDLELGVEYWFLVKTEKEGKITVPAKVLSNFISLLPDKKVTLEERSQFLHINCENYETKIKGLNAEDFPIIPKIDNKEFIELDSRILCESISEVVDFSTPNQNRPELSGVYFDFQKSGVRLVATDGFRLAEKTFPVGSDLSKSFHFILPQRAAKEIINIFSEKEGEVRLYFAPNQVSFECLMEEIPHTQIRFTSRLVEGDYPDYQGIIPKRFAVQAVLGKEDFLNQIKTASIFSGRGNEVKVKVNYKTEGVEMFSQDPDIGESRGFSAGKINLGASAQKELEVIFNHRFLADGVLCIKSKNVIFEINEEEGPAALKPEGDQNYIYVVMPINPS